MLLHPRHIKGIFLDLDDTLYSYTPCNKAGKQAVFKHLAQALKKPSEVIGAAFEKGRQQTKELLKMPAFELAASHSRLLYYQKTLEELMGHTDSKLTLKCEQIFWDTFMKEMTLFPGAHEFLERAKAAKKIVAIVTDMTTQTQLQKLVKLGIAELIDFVVTSEESGRDKPAPASLLLALKKTGLRSQETVFIGEDEVRDIAAARAADIIPLSLHQKPADPTVIFVNNFDELTKILAL